MKIKATDPDIFSICTRIERGILDLKPDFQRGDVWNTTKKKLLVDSILRDWQVPPVHVIRNNEVQEVLDGQQRLRAIYDFYNGIFSVNGKIEPQNEKILALDGLKYDDLPSEMKLQFDHYSIRIFEITEYSSGEPGELFNRLNNALNLTSAEKRNALIGCVTSQAKELVRFLEGAGLNKEFLGFSNNRMAYDDLLVRICFMLENDGLSTKTTDSILKSRYIKDTPFDEEVFSAVEQAINLLGEIKTICIRSRIDVHVTKATAFSWIYFISKLFKEHKNSTDCESIIKAFLYFEGNRYQFRNHLDFEKTSSINISKQAFESVFELYNERASSKVMTFQSMMIREVLIAMFYYRLSPRESQISKKSKSKIDDMIGQLQAMESDTKLVITNFVSNSFIEEKEL